jgi:DNA-binding transcriptional ArsR family regulator
MARSLADVAALLKLAGRPTRAGILLALADGPRGTTALAEAAGHRVSPVSNELVLLRLGGLVETATVGKRRVHSLTERGRVLAEAIRKLSEN